MLLSTCHPVPGREVAELLGVVKGNTIRARHLGRGIMAGLKNLVGGEIAEYTKLMGKSREQSVDRMVRSAEVLGADAILGVRLTTSMVMSQAAEIICYGTAVRPRQYSWPNGAAPGMEAARPDKPP
ncbi:MAG: YbjQ family protein [Candidatus Eisenbacteria sp.]|nr:YbjQ family protein [Candidatus Eisenbacteria bacterium]